MQAPNCVLFCLHPFCREVNESCLPHNKNDSDSGSKGIQTKPYTICSLHKLGLEVEVERPGGAIHVPLSTILHNKSTEWKSQSF